MTPTSPNLHCDYNNYQHTTKQNINIHFFYFDKKRRSVLANTFILFDMEH